jgi:hypothetical protein
MAAFSVRDFYDGLAPDYHLKFGDWEASISRQATVLEELFRRHPGPAPRRVLDCSCGIGTQAIGPALAGHRIFGSDLSPVAAARATAEAAARGVSLPVAAADMRLLPFVSSAFDVVVCADNALPTCCRRGTSGRLCWRCDESSGTADCWCSLSGPTTRTAAPDPYRRIPTSRTPRGPGDHLSAVALARGR